jgi:hypothetical protein
MQLHLVRGRLHLLRRGRLHLLGRGRLHLLGLGGRGGGDTFSGSVGGVASPPQARRARVAAPSQARWVRAAASPPSPAFWMVCLTLCTRLRKKKLLDSLHGDQIRWYWVFLVSRLTKFWLAGIYIDKTVNRQAASHAPQNLCPLRTAIGHKKSHVVTRRCVTVHILFKILNVQVIL